MTPITRLGNVVTTLGLASTPEPLDEVVLAGLGEHRDDYDVEAIAAAARAVIEGALPDGVYLVGEDLMVEVAAWPRGPRPGTCPTDGRRRPATPWTRTPWPGSGPATRSPDARSDRRRGRGLWLRAAPGLLPRRRRPPYPHHPPTTSRRQS